MPIVAERNWVAIRRDRRIHTRPLEVRVFTEVGLRTVWLGGKKDMGSPRGSGGQKPEPVSQQVCVAVPGCLRIRPSC